MVCMAQFVWHSLYGTYFLAMLVGSVKNASLFQKFTLNLIGFRVWLKRADKVSFNSSYLLDWNVMFTNSSINNIELIYMAVVFVFY